MAGADDPQVLEGFICPICKSDLGDASKLLFHFEDVHSEEQDFIKSFKGKVYPVILLLKSSICLISCQIFDMVDV